MEDSTPKNRIRSWIAICFCAFVLLMAAVNVKLAARPALSFLMGEESFKEMTKEIAENYVSSKLWLRSDFINCNGLFARMTGRRAYNQTMLMNNGMLNYGSETFSEAPDETLETNLSDSVRQLSEYLQTIDIPMFFVLAPVKEDLEGELLPKPFHNYQNDTGDHLLALLSDKGVDTESDRYTYSFNGKSGIFRYAVENNMVIKTLPYTPLKIEENGVGYKITDTDGTKYYFMAEEKNRADFTYGGESKTMAWYLTKIEFADRNDSIVFRYTQYNYYYQQYRSEYIHKGLAYSCSPDEYNDNWYSYSTTSNNSTTHTTECTNLLLSQILWRGNSVNFSYTADRQDYIMYILNNKLPRLTNITVRNYNQSTIRTITFDNAHYVGGTALSNRMFLEGLTITGSSSSAGSETYSFNYNSLSLPNYYKATFQYPSTSDTQCHEDYWGYANNTSSNYWTPSDYAISPSTGGNRSVNQAYAKSGILEKITYPTGGYTIFSFESNKLDDNTLWGGLRLNNSVTYDANGSQLSQRTYLYSGAVPTVDNLENLYQFESYYYYYYHEWTSWRLVQHDAATLHDVSVSMPVVPLTTDYGFPIYYQSVTEFYGTANSNMGKTVYTYIDGRTGDRDDYEDTTASSSEGLRTYSKTYNIDQGVISPLLSSRKVYENNNGNYDLNHSEEYSYDEIDINGFLAGVHFVSKAVFIDLGPSSSPAPLTYFDDIYTFHNVYAVPSFYRLASKTVKDYGAQVATTTTYGYDSQLRTLDPISEKVSSLSGDNYENRYSYPFDLSGYSSLTAANMLIPVQTRTYRNNTLAATVRKSYAQQNGIIVNTGISTAKGNNSLESRAAYTYDTGVISACIPLPG